MSRTQLEGAENSWLWNTIQIPWSHHRPTAAPPQPFSSSVPGQDGTNTELRDEKKRGLVAVLQPPRRFHPYFDQGKCSHISLFWLLLQARGSKSESLLKVSRNAALKNRQR